MKAELLDGAPLGTVAVCHQSGWMQSDIFLQWMKHFASHVKPSIEDPVLLLLDGHATHTKNIEVINYARAHGIVMLCFPPHCTHRLQPLDVSFMAPLSAYYSQENKMWLRNNPGRVVTQYQICQLFGRAYEKAATVQTAASGFRKTGIYPADPNVFGEADFAAAETTERERDTYENSQNINNDASVEISVTDMEQREDSVQQGNEELIRPVTPQPGPSGLINSSLKATYDNDQNKIVKSPLPGPSTFPKSPKELFPVPQAKRSAEQHRRKRGKAAILTESPYKNELEEVLEKQKQKKVGAVKRNLTAKVKQKKTKKHKKEIISSSSDEDEIQEKSDSEDELCIYCDESYYATKKKEEWVQCMGCTKWAHEGCTGLRQVDLYTFKCNNCTFS